MVIRGDWNAKSDTGRSGWERVMGKYGFEGRNEKGKKLLEFAVEHESTICNTKFQQTAEKGLGGPEMERPKI